MKYQKFVETTLTEATKMAMACFKNISSINKPGDNNQVLTQADLDIGQYIISQAKKYYPEFNIIDEEAGVIDNSSKYTWVIDPIDGTSNFASGVETFGIMLGLLEDDTPIAGGIAVPAFNEIYYAEKTFGAFCNNVKINSTKETDLSKCLVAYGIDSYKEKPEQTKKELDLLEDIILEIRNLRTAGCMFDLINVARGSYGGLVKQTSKIWDNIAQQIIAEESGCVYTDLTVNQLLDYQFERSMSRAGTPTDNGYAERFVGIFKHSVVERYRYEKIEEFSEFANKWLNYYNKRRPHQSLGQNSPNEYARKNKLSVVRVLVPNLL